MRQFIATVRDANGEHREIKVHAATKDLARGRLTELGYIRILWIF